MSDVDILIPTLRRPDHLTRALRSVFSQTRLAELVATVAVIDNSPEGSARAVIEALRPACPVALLLVHEPTPGVATARNAGVAATHAPLVAFLDDDEEAPPDWIEALRTAHLQLGAAVTFGPVRGVAEGAPARYRTYLDRFFSRQGSSDTQVIAEVFGCGNSMMSRAAALSEPAPFDIGADLTGGEDDRLFARLRAEGARFGWAGTAFVYEHAPPHRARVSYALKRAFCYGQSPSELHHLARDWSGLARSVTIGFGQAATYGLLALTLFAAGRRSAAVEVLDRAVRGAGKVLWFVRINLYGLAGTAKVDPERAGAAPDLAPG